MSETWLGKVGNLLAQRLDALNVHIHEVSEHLKAGAIRFRKFAWEQVKLLMTNLRLLLAIAWSFLGLVWIASGFLELVYWRSTFWKILGWLGTCVTSAIVVTAVWTLFRPATEEQHQSRGSGPGFAVVHIIAVVVLAAGTQWQYQFHSPVLRFAQGLYTSAMANAENIKIVIPSRVRSYFFAKPIVSSSANAIADQKQSLDQKQVLADIPRSLIGASVHDKNSFDQNSWVPAYEKQTIGSEEVSMWVEEFWLSDRGTVVTIAAKAWPGWTDARLMKSDGGYFVDDYGKRYDLRKDYGNYNSEGVRICKADEICKVRLEFPPLDHRPQYILLHHPQFPALRVELEWPRSSDDVAH